MSSDAPVRPTPVLSEHLPLPVELHPNIDHFITEDDTPVDNQFSEKQQRLLAETLYNSWQPGESFVAMSNVGVFFAIQTPPLVPDNLVSLGVSSPADPFPKKNRSYLIWEYGKPPDVAVEIVSNKDGGEDSTKLKGYAKIGITYYVIYDPEQHLSPQVLRAYRLSGGRYELYQSEKPFFESIGLGVAIWDGTYEDMTQPWVRWTSADGAFLPTGKEQSIANKELAILEKERAEAEKLRADEATSVAARLAAKLKALGIDPDV